MKIWLTKNNEIPIREQIITQVRLAVASGEILPGDKLPSTRELARRFGVHPNTISSAYSELTTAGEVENRKGSGVYVLDGQTKVQGLDALLTDFFAKAETLGFKREAIVERIIGAETGIRGFALIEPNPDLRQILTEEISTAANIPVLNITADEIGSVDLSSYRLVALFDEEPKLSAKIAPGECIFLKPNSVADSMKGKDRPHDSEMIVIASNWSDFLNLARLFLLAAKIPAESIVTCSPKNDGWQRCLKTASRIICDSYTAKQIGVDERLTVFKIISQASLDELSRRTSI